MNEEEKKAIEMLDKFITEHKFYNIKQSDNLEDNIKIILNFIEKLQKENEEKTILLFAGAEKVKKLETEKEELMKLMVHKNGYTKKLEEDLFENASNYVIPKQKLKDKIEELNQYYKKAIYPSLYQWCDITITEHYDEMIALLQELIEGE